MTQDHILFSRFDHVEPSLLRFRNQLLLRAVVVDVMNRTSNHATLVRLTGLENLIEPRTHVLRLVHSGQIRVEYTAQRRDGAG